MAAQTTDADAIIDQALAAPEDATNVQTKEDRPSDYTNLFLRE